MSAPQGIWGIIVGVIIAIIVVALILNFTGAIK